jgi:colanic acid/amylovoran biosynthesis glycosyltransferase
MKLGLLFNKEPVWSETFLRTQVERLEAESVYLDGMGFPSGDWVEPCRALLAERRFEACLVNYGTVAAWLAPLLIESGTPFVVHFHGFDAHRKTGLEEIHKRYPLMLEAAAEVVVVSSTMREALMAWGVPENNIRLNPYGVPPVPETLVGEVERDPNLVLAAGRFVEKKAPYLVLTAFREVWLARPQTRLCWIGDGELRGVCDAMVRGWGMEEAVEFTGVRTREEILRGMREAAVFIQHSVTAASGDMEGTPNTILEAATMGCPIVATRHAGIADVVADASFGRLVEEYDVAGMAAAVAETLLVPSEAAERAARLRERVLVEYREERYLDGLRASLERARAEAGFSDALRRRVQEEMPSSRPKDKPVKAVPQKPATAAKRPRRLTLRERLRVLLTGR